MFLVSVLGCVVFLALVGLGFYALHKITPGWLRIQTSFWRLITFSMEIGRPADITKKPRNERGELDSGDGDGSVQIGL